jgi:DNA invertase Pin-like site-specific DNA recombinase
MASNARVPAAQYLPMSTEHQRYSLVNQASRILKYAENHGFSVIQTYSDPARSGFIFRRREGLQQYFRATDKKEMQVLLSSASNTKK